MQWPLQSLMRTEQSVFERDLTRRDILGLFWCGPDCIYPSLHSEIPALFLHTPRLYDTHDEKTILGLSELTKDGMGWVYG